MRKVQFILWGALRQTLIKKKRLCEILNLVAYIIIIIIIITI